jgi:transcription initiation factor IIF auxiliary subunit
LTHKYVDSVVYHLHSTQQISTVVTKVHPYLCSRSYSGKFTVVMKVNFKEWTQLDPVRVEFVLDNS